MMVIVMFQNNKILILGFARSGYQAEKVLMERGNTVILNDSKDESKIYADQVRELRDLGVELVFGSHPDDLLDDTYDYLIKNPGVPIDHKYVLKAKELGIEVINEVEMAYRLLPKDVSIIGITGTNGKTTTTTMYRPCTAATTACPAARPTTSPRPTTASCGSAPTPGCTATTAGSFAGWTPTIPSAT